MRGIVPLGDHVDLIQLAKSLIVISRGILGKFYGDSMECAGCVQAFRLILFFD